MYRQEVLERIDSILIRGELNIASRMQYIIMALMGWVLLLMTF